MAQSKRGRYVQGVCRPRDAAAAWEALGEAQSRIDERVLVLSRAQQFMPEEEHPLPPAAHGHPPERSPCGSGLLRSGNRGAH